MPLKYQNKTKKNYVMPKLKKMKIKYVQIKADPEEIQRRLDKAYDILFNETYNQNTTNKI